MRLLLLVVLVGSSAAAQDARLVLRDAAFAEGDGVQVDTTGWEAVPFDGRTLRLGEVVQELGEGTVARATVDYDPYTNAPMVSLTLSPEAAVTFAELTASRRGRAIAILLDGRVLLAPTIQEQIDGGRIQISGSFTQKEVLTIVSAVRSTINGPGE